MRISDWSSDVCSSDLAGARALQRRAELPADSLEEFCAERLVELATDRRADLVIDLGARRQSRTTLRSSSDSARRGHDDLIVGRDRDLRDLRSEEHTSEIQSLMRISYAVFCLKKKKMTKQHNSYVEIT